MPVDLVLPIRQGNVRKCCILAATVFFVFCFSFGNSLHLCPPLYRPRIKQLYSCDTFYFGFLSCYLSEQCCIIGSVLNCDPYSTFMKSTLLSSGASLRNTKRKFSSSGRIMWANWKTGHSEEVSDNKMILLCEAFHPQTLSLIHFALGEHNTNSNHYTNNPDILIRSGISQYNICS